MNKVKMIEILSIWQLIIENIPSMMKCIPF